MAQFPTLAAFENHLQNIVGMNLPANLSDGPARRREIGQFLVDTVLENLRGTITPQALGPVGWGDVLQHIQQIQQVSAGLIQVQIRRDQVLPDHGRQHQFQVAVRTHNGGNVVFNGAVPTATHGLTPRGLNGTKGTIRDIVNAAIATIGDDPDVPNNLRWQFNDIP
eukprot:TRINITY_DN30101_c0_g1_i1.p1 TRINITY_DN30101_c0_g1~~TRINITY_DN30101_c0_g1_i1.p1  ORF type:complete len:166 (+),score=15.47 TRINITY_DN30101_c0_g1_i1:86-583(+)